MDIKRVATETLEILGILGAEYVNKLPKDLMNFIIDNADSESEIFIDPNIRIEENPNISKDTRIFLTMLKMQYWSDSKEEKMDILKTLKANEKKSNNANTNNN